MVEQASHRGSYETEFDGYDDNINNQHIAPYRFAQSDRDHSIPLFLSDANGEPDPNEYIAPVRRKPRNSISFRILAGVVATAAIAILVALFSSDAARDIMISAEASFAAVLPTPSAAAVPDPAQLTARDIQLKDPTRLAAPFNQSPGARNITTAAVVSPTRAEITTAYQTAIQGRAAPAATPAPAPSSTAPPTRRLEADELATLLSRAKGLLAAGDIPPARLLLERAADAQDAGAALLLGRTYDPDVLGTQDARNITPEPATARAWYQRAAQLGSTDAQRRLSQLQN